MKKVPRIFKITLKYAKQNFCNDISVIILVVVIVDEVELKMFQAIFLPLNKELFVRSKMKPIFASLGG